MKRTAVVVQALWLPVIVCGLLACSALHLLPGLLHSECEMTYMYSWPQYQKLNLSQDLQRSFPQYSLHLYRERLRKEEPTLDWTPLRLRGLPALFIPGNAGSHKQVRSSGSIALQMHRREFPKLRHFDFFTVNLNEEFSGLFGGVLHRQTEFVAASIKHILSLYPLSPSRPSSVLIIAHSMGGMVAQALFTLPNFTSSLVSTIVSLSSPLARPVLAFDPTLLDFYKAISETWYGGGGVASHVTLVSISGGDSDVQVPPHLTIPNSVLVPRTSSPVLPPPIAAYAVPRNWVSADHRAVVWCRRLQLAVTRALFLLQDPSTNQLTSDPHQQRSIFRHLLFTGWKVPIQPINTTVNSELWTLVESLPHYSEGHSQLLTALPLPLSPPLSSHLLVATNSDTTHWLFACSLSSAAIANCTDLSPLAKLLPPRGRVVKYTRLGERDFRGATHVVINRKETTAGREKKREPEFILMERCEDETRDLPLPLWGSAQLHFPPSSLCTLTIFTLPHLKYVWTAHSLTIISSCVGVKGGLLLPWFPHTPLLHDNGTGVLTIPLSIQVSVPDGATPELLVWGQRNCSLSLSLSPSFLPLAGKLFVLYAPLLLPWITAVALSSDQLLGELVVLAVVWGATSLGVPPGTDWEQLTSEGLWTAWSPLLIHIVARGLLTILHSLLKLLTSSIHWCLAVKWRGILAVLLAVLWLPSSMLCGAMGLCCVLVVYTLMVRDEHTGRVQGLLTCLLVLSLPSIGSWMKAIRYSWQLLEDPLFWPLEMTSALSLLFLWLSQNTRSESTVWKCGLLSPLPGISLLSSPSHLISLTLLLYATTHPYRVAYFITASIFISLLTAGLTHAICCLATLKP